MTITPSFACRLMTPSGYRIARPRPEIIDQCCLPPVSSYGGASGELMHPMHTKPIDVPDCYVISSCTCMDQEDPDPAGCQHVDCLFKLWRGNYRGYRSVIESFIFTNHGPLWGPLNMRIDFWLDRRSVLEPLFIENSERDYLEYLFVMNRGNVYHMLKEYVLPTEQSLLTVEEAHEERLNRLRAFSYRFHEYMDPCDSTHDQHDLLSLKELAHLKSIMRIMITNNAIEKFQAIYSKEREERQRQRNMEYKAAREAKEREVKRQRAISEAANALMASTFDSDIGLQTAVDFFEMFLTENIPHDYGTRSYYDFGEWYDDHGQVLFDSKYETIDMDESILKLSVEFYDTWREYYDIRPLYSDTIIFLLENSPNQNDWKKYIINFGL